MRRGRTVFCGFDGIGVGSVGDLLLGIAGGGVSGAETAVCKRRQGA